MPTVAGGRKGSRKKREPLSKKSGKRSKSKKSGKRRKSRKGKKGGK